MNEKTSKQKTDRLPRGCKIQILSLHPGDVLVVGVPPQKYSQAFVDKAQTIIRRFIPEEVKILFKSEDMQLTVLRPKKNETQT